MFQYIKRLYLQCLSLYRIKKQLQLIHNKLSYNTSVDTLTPECEILKHLVFNCGSIYIKFLQWYISKLKSNIIENLNTIEARNITKFINYFEDIFDNCPYHSLEHTKEIFKQSMFGINIEEYVDITTLKAIASGSIGQVYYARRLSDNTEIAIKVKHPDITNNLDNYLEIIKLFKFLQSFNYIKKRYNLIFNIDDFLNDIIQQCDLRIEASNSKKFKDNFSESSKYIIFPDILFQSEDMLISQYIAGIPLEQLSAVQTHQVTINFVCFFYQMLLVDNFIHGDLHCKNWKVKLSNGHPQLIIYDCGICFSNINSDITKDFWFSMAKYDIKKLTSTVLLYINITNNTEFDTDISKEIVNIFNNILKDSLSISLLLKVIVHFFTKHNFIIHKFLINLCVLVCVIEEYFKNGNIINGNAQEQETTNLFEIINDLQLDIIAFCDVNRCYPKVAALFNKELNNKFSDYTHNIKTNKNINNNNKNNNTTPILFSTLSLSTLKFKPPT